MSRAAKTIYFMRQEGSLGPVKIGCSHYPPGRLESLSIWSPVKLIVAATFPGSFREERALHYRFREQLSHHEWFHWSQELEDLIQEVAAGDFNPSSLPSAPRGAVTRDSSYVTTQWRYQRSVVMRLAHIERRTTMPWPKALMIRPKTSEIVTMTVEQMDREKPRIEAEIAAYKNMLLAPEYIRPSRRSPRPTKPSERAA